MIRYSALLFLFISGCAGFFVDAHGLCVYNLYSENSLITYISEINGAAGEDAAAFYTVGLVSLLFILLLSWIKNKIIYVLVIFLMLLIQHLFLKLWVESTHYTELVYDSILRCGSASILIMLIGHVMFLLLSLSYLIKKKKSYR
ncbi:hypothetical protein EC844_109123 [Acinetobacter calcoaceticus]|uniref:Lipoprotein n=1 Tax=Acinetobacter calcoaceticus TaxID=471 RepID=A0A4R1XW19_ACICA|nr:hypothetical protein EC844_109123 [Acinetobacter calcoaceticus]